METRTAVYFGRNKEQPRMTRIYADQTAFEICVNPRNLRPRKFAQRAIFHKRDHSGVRLIWDVLARASVMRVLANMRKR
jgi:hypothetical protein